MFVGLLLVAGGCVSVYLASPNQRWWAASLPAKPARLAGTVLLIAGLVVLMQTLRAPAALFVFVHWLMLLFVLFPYFGALRSSRRRESP
ncbi:hypothetical protein DLREEDagrD3_21460 [Denitratisoma sp. agr-D3]